MAPGMMAATESLVRQQEALCDRPSTSRAAAALLAASSSNTKGIEPRALNAAITRKVKVVVLPAGYPQVIEEAILDKVGVTWCDSAVSFVGIQFRVGRVGWGRTQPTM